MDIALVARKGNIHLLSYKGISGKKHYTLKWCKRDEQEAVVDEDNQQGAVLTDAANGQLSTNTNNFSVFQKKRVNRLGARKFHDKALMADLKKSYLQGDAESFRVLIKNSVGTGQWGIELEEFLKRETGYHRIFHTFQEACLFCQSCWSDSIQYWLVNGKLSSVQCLEQIFNLEERLQIESNNREIRVDDGLLFLKQELQSQLLNDEQLDRSLVNLYVNYGFYNQAETMTAKDPDSLSVMYMEALISKVGNSVLLSVLSPSDMCLLLEKIVECSEAYKGVFSYFSSGHHKWQQLNICVIPLLETIRGRINGNMFKSSATANDLLSLGTRVLALESLLDDRSCKKKIKAVVKVLNKLYKLCVDKEAQAVLNQKIALSEK